MSILHLQEIKVCDPLTDYKNLIGRLMNVADVGYGVLGFSMLQFFAQVQEVHR